MRNTEINKEPHHSPQLPSAVEWRVFPGSKQGFLHMLEISLISSRIKDMQGRADALRGYL